MPREDGAYGIQGSRTARGPPKEAVADEIERVEAVDGQGDDTVESGGGADVDEVEEAVDGGSDGDGEERHRCARFGMDRGWAFMHFLQKPSRNPWAAHLTRLRYRQHGRPRSRAKAHVIRDEESTNLIVAIMLRAVPIVVMTVLGPVDPVT